MAKTAIKKGKQDGGKDFVKVIKCVKSPKSGAYSFKEAIDHSDFIIGGTSNQFKSDNEGPEVNIYIDDMNFISGDRVSKSPLLIVEAYDESGLNLTKMNSYQKMIGIVDDTTLIYLNGKIIPKYLFKKAKGYDIMKSKEEICSSCPNKVPSG